MINFSRLAQLAIHTRKTTKSEITSLVRAARIDGLFHVGTTQAAAVEVVAELIKKITTVRTKRAKNRPAKAQTFTQRVAAKTLATVAADVAKYARYRTCTQGHETRVSVGTPAVSTDTTRGGRYSSRCTFDKLESIHKITVHPYWLVRVDASGLSVVDGMLTLDAEPIRGHGPELFRATWIEQAAGTGLKLVRGYIARLGETSYHAATAKAALSGVQRKSGQKPARRQPTIDLDKWVRVAGETPVFFADSTDAGNCESGTSSWCHAVGIDPAGETTLADVITGYKLRPIAEALAVIRRVVRDRHNRKPFDLAQLNGAAKLLGDGRIVSTAEGGFRVENN